MSLERSNVAKTASGITPDHVLQRKALDKFEFRSALTRILEAIKSTNSLSWDKLEEEIPKILEIFENDEQSEFLQIEQINREDCASEIPRSTIYRIFQGKNISSIKQLNTVYLWSIFHFPIMTFSGIYKEYYRKELYIKQRFAVSLLEILQDQEFTDSRAIDYARGVYRLFRPAPAGVFWETMICRLTIGQTDQDKFECTLESRYMEVNGTKLTSDRAVGKFAPYHNRAIAILRIGARGAITIMFDALREDSAQNNYKKVEGLLTVSLDFEHAYSVPFIAFRHDEEFEIGKASDEIFSPADVIAKIPSDFKRMMEGRSR